MGAGTEGAETVGAGTVVVEIETGGGTQARMNATSSRSSLFSVARASHCCESLIKAAKISRVWREASGGGGG